MLFRLQLVNGPSGTLRQLSGGHPPLPTVRLDRLFATRTRLSVALENDPPGVVLRMRLAAAARTLVDPPHG